MKSKNGHGDKNEPTPAFFFCKFRVQRPVEASQVPASENIISPHDTPPLGAVHQDSHYSCREMRLYTESGAPGDRLFFKSVYGLRPPICLELRRVGVSGTWVP